MFSGNQIHDLDIYIMFYLCYKINIGATVVTVGKTIDVTENVTFERNTAMLCNKGNH